MVLFSPASSLSLISNSNSPTTLSFNAGWYLLQIIMAISLNRFQEIQTLSNITLSTRNEIYFRCYSVYLTEKQIQILSTFPEITISRRLDNMYRSPKQLLEFDETGKCQVKAIPNWTPLNKKCNFTSKSDNLFIAYCKCSEILPDERIFNASPYEGKKLLNRYNTGYLQSGSQSGFFDNGSIISPHPIFDIGIHGENQIISITDTGVNNAHPFFFDPNVPFKDNVTLPNHRKIHKYYNFADNTDGPQGHGTHCAGIAAGESYASDSGISLYNGMAPKAKLVVVDIGFTGHDLDGEFNILRLYESLENDGACVNSNSWGLDLNVDTRPDTVAYDYLAYIHPHLLFTFAAGNEGRRHPYYTINSPGDSKNVLSIGGIGRTQLHSIEYTNNWALEVNGQRYSTTYSNKGENPRESTRGYPMKKLGNLTIINYKPDQNLSNKIVFVNGVNEQQLFCNDNDMSSNLPAAVVTTTNFNNCPSYIRCPIYQLSQTSNDIITKLTVDIKAVGNGSIFENFQTDQQNQPQLGAYSSKGPTTLGFAKPDVVVNGEALSANSGEHNLDLRSLIIKSGTSMATPAASGLLALINQYFTDGYYPYGKKDSKNGFLPTSTFLRAALINSAVPYQTKDYGPNVHAGFGIPNISSILLEPQRIVKNMTINSHSKHKYVIRTTSNTQSLRITMAYLDPPLDDTSVLPLFADLDLILISPSGVIYTGNQKKNGQTEVSNTIERVIVDKSQVEIGEYVILVTSSDFNDPDVQNISYSLFVNGPFNQLDFEANKPDMVPIIDSNTCDFKCNNGGICGSDGFCQCDSNHTGYDCSITYQTYEPNEMYSIDIVDSLHYAHFPIGYIVPNTNLTVRVKTSRSVKYEALLMFLSENKISTPSSPEVLPILKKGGREETYSLSISSNESLTQETPLDLYLVLKSVSAYPMNVQIEIKAQIVPKTLPPSRTPKIRPTRSKIPPTPSKPIERTSSIIDNSDVIIPSPSLNIGSTDLDSSFEYSHEYEYSNSQIDPELVSSQTQSDNKDTMDSVNPAKVDHMKTFTFGFVIGFIISIMIILIIALITFLVTTYKQKREQREKDEFYSRTEEPKLEIETKENDIEEDVTIPIDA